MSAFIVEDKTINRVISWLERSPQDFGSHLLSTVLKAADIRAYDDEWRDKLGATMAEMNADAVNQRYGENQTAAHEFSWEICTDIQALKSLQCWHYQCAEGDIPDRPLFKAFEEVERQLAASIVSRLPEYEKAAWG